MSERILRALMQMFAIIAKVDGINNTGRQIVQSFLKSQLNLEQVETYLKIFDEYLESHQNTNKKKEGAAKRTSLNSVKILKICTQINQELEQPQRVIVLIRLLEFIHSSNEISEQENEFVLTVADTFNIPMEEFNLLTSFVEDGLEVVPNNPNILIINNQEVGNLNQSKHIYCETLPQDVRVIQIESVSMYALRIYGNFELQLNGQGISKERVHIFTPGSSIRSSKIKPIYYSDVIGHFLSDESRPRITFEVKNLEYKFKGGKLGLRDININEESGKLIGIMGGSGAGKSTLLNVLNSMETPSAGSVKINGKNIHTEKDQIQGVIGHVSQDDLLIEELTVYENLFYNAKLCFGNLGDDEIAERCNTLLADIGLSETRNLKVGSPLEKTISGGQRKRLNISLELIREPSVLFVDEPTSGLSSRDSENIMDLLKELALKGKLIFVVIHQPSSEIYKMFDKLMILDVGGYPIYYGNPVDAVSYFKRLVNHVNAEESECWNCGNVNPEQIFNIIESKVLDEYGNLTYNRKVSPLEWNVQYRERIESNIHSDKKHTEIPESIFKIPNIFKQFKVFITRDVKSKLTNTQYLMINFLEAPVLAFILAYLVRFFNTDVDTSKGYVFGENENIPAYMFMSVVVALFIGLTVSAEEIIRDRKIRKRESFLNLSKGSYLWSKILIMFSLSAVQTLTFVIVGNSVLGIKGMYTDYWMILFTTSCFANILGLNISSAFNSAVTIYILIPFLIIPQLLLAGVVVKFDKLNPTLASQGSVPISGEVMASRWAFEALAVNQFKENNYERNFYKYDKSISVAQYKKDYWMPKLESKIVKIENELRDGKKLSDVKADIELIYNEIDKETKINKKVACPVLKQINVKDYNTSVATGIKTYLTNIKNYYINVQNTAYKKLDEVKLSMQKTPEEKEAFLQLAANYDNENLNNLVKNAGELNRCIEKDGKLIQQIDPVFQDPTGSKIGRAHFFAPRKNFFGMYFSTYWFNICVIWMMSISLIFTLYFEIFKKILDALGSIKFTKKKAF
ncbi:MAG: ATP-binding cassette domain-containing protein [Bacteroidota bacterium]|nr:ATP-binding cassette domain-containing protein [Bacteroidota bacterium]MDP3145289.1 ATP-binding cassette domain-containing protein [Bacteroidota bacterium]MDP3556877.1 ATP-binding cassette domain-containing protein [Bacteroidota bacterium]